MERITQYNRATESPNDVVIIFKYLVFLCLISKMAFVSFNY